MAAGTVKGITIEIEGKTSGLVKSLGDVNSSLSLTQKSLKTVNQALKLDPGNVDALAKKQGILKTAIEQTKEKLELEKKAAEDAAKALEEGTITKSQYDLLQAEVAKTSSEMNKLEKESNETAKALDKAAKTDKFAKLKSALGGIGTALKVAGKATAAMVGGVTTAAGALVKLTTNTAETADEIDKMSQKIGISKQSYQEWSYVMGQNGMDVNALQSGMKTLNTQMLKAQNATDASSTALGRLGVSVTDSSGKLRSQEDVLYDTIAALADMPEGAERAKLAQELLGKSGTELAPLLNQGGQAIKDLTQRAHDLGLVMSDEAVDAGVKLGDTMDDVKKSVKALGTRLGSSLMPIVQKMADKLLEYMPKFQELFDKIAPAIETFLDTVLPLLLDLVDQLLPPLLDLVSSLLPPLTELMSAILPVIVDLLGLLLPPVIEIVQAVMPVLITLVDAIIPIIKTVTDILKPLIDLVLALIKPLLELINKILQPVIDLFGGVGDVLSNTVGPAIDLIGGLLNTFLGPAFEAIGDIVGVVTDIVFGSWEKLGERLKKLWEGLKEFAEDIWDGICRLANAAIEAVSKPINGMQNRAMDKLLQNNPELKKQWDQTQNYAGANSNAIRAQQSARSNTNVVINTYVGSNRVQTTNNKVAMQAAFGSGGR